MQIRSAEFVTSANAFEDCPVWDHPEFAFIGRSNVGKSSMINMLTGRHGLAKVSSTPGKTRLLNFFLINQNWGLVDLPGYGFAKASKAQKGKFNEIVSNYLLSRPNLRLVFVLIDARHSPQAIDLEFVAWLGEVQVPFELVFTKADKLPLKKAKANVQEFVGAMAEFVVSEPEAVLSSAKARTGRNEVLAVVRELMAE